MDTSPARVTTATAHPTSLPRDRCFNVAMIIDEVLLSYSSRKASMTRDPDRHLGGYLDKVFVSAVNELFLIAWSRPIPAFPGKVMLIRPPHEYNARLGSLINMYMDSRPPGLRPQSSISVLDKWTAMTRGFMPYRAPDFLCHPRPITFQRLSYWLFHYCISDLVTWLKLCVFRWILVHELSKL